MAKFIEVRTCDDNMMLILVSTIIAVSKEQATATPSQLGMNSIVITDAHQYSLNTSYEVIKDKLGVLSL